MNRIPADDNLTDRVAPGAYLLQHAIHDSTKHRKPALGPEWVSRPSAARLESSIYEKPYSLEQFVEEASSKPDDETVLYLAYGSNLQAAKFRGERGIRPLSQINVQVPSLRMTFDLPGIPYVEPCFANTARRDSKNAFPTSFNTEKTALLSGTSKEKYRKRDWHKSMIGVVYEVTPKDYAHIIATEGGGAGYQDILVDCHPFESYDPNDPVPEVPTSPPFKAHTLFAPRLPDGEEPPKRGGHVQRPDPDYAQASERYLKIITEGAAECELPYEYQDYLGSIRPYTITTTQQRLGQFILLALWMPVVLSVFGLNKLFVDKHGRLPGWCVQLMNAVLRAVWASYDSFFKPMFGDGERSLEDGDDDEQSEERMDGGRTRVKDAEKLEHAAK